MLVYYNRYGRRDGFCFFSSQWPEGIDPDPMELQGAGYLWTIFPNLFGDHGVSLSAPSSQFILRDCFGPLHATVSGIASVKMDGRRSVTQVDFVVRIPRNAQELLDDPDPDALLKEVQQMVSRQVQPGFQCEAPGPLPQLDHRQVPGQAAQRICRELAWRDAAAVAVGPTAGAALAAMKRELYLALPSDRRRRFSVITYCANWKPVYDLGGVDLIGTSMPEETFRQDRQFHQLGQPLFFWEETSGRIHSPASLQDDPGLPYLYRLYPSLVREGSLDLPADSLELVRGLDFFKACTGLTPVSAQAFSLMVRASRSRNGGPFLPTREEKRAVASLLRI